MKIEGKLIEKFAIQEVTDSFKKREFVVEYSENPQYVETIKFELIQASCDLLEEFVIGSQISIQFNLKGRKWVDKSGETRYFNSLQVWKIENLNQMATAQDLDHSEPSEGEDDLPF